MVKDEMVLNQNPVEQETQLELDTDTTPEGEVEDQGGDPYDNLSQEELLKIAKKNRAIISRNKGKEKPVEETPKEEKKPQDDYVKRSDFEKANQKKAIKSITEVSADDPEDVKLKKKDILDNWDKVRVFYTPRRGKATAEDIAEDINDAYVIFNNRREKPLENDETDSRQITETTVKTPGGSTQTPKAGGKSVDEKLRIRKSVDPSDWFPKKSE